MAANPRDRVATSSAGRLPGLGPSSLLVRGYLDRMSEVLAGVDDEQLAACLETLWQIWSDDRTVFLVGNGGSASTASHMACDLSKQTQLPGRRPLRAHSLSDSVELMTAIGNDADYSRIFAEQLRIHGRPGDLLVCISCSGNSGNILAAIDEAHEMGIRVMAFGGTDGGRMRELADIYLHVPSHDYGHIESAHLIFDHCLTNLLFEYGKMTMNPRPAVFVDRDGVIIRNRDDYVKAWEEVELIDGSLDALALLSRAGHRVFVVTNQSAVGRGIVTQLQLDEMHRRLATLVAHNGGRIEAFLVCSHCPEDGCGCRKPEPGLLYQARDLFGLDLEGTYFIGDHASDAEAAATAGCSSILVLSGRTEPDAAAAVKADHVVPNLKAAARHIVGQGAGMVSGHRLAAEPA